VNVGPYEVVAEIGRGGSGVVFRARAPDGRDFAVKLLAKPAVSRTGATPPSSDSAFVRFERERRLLAELGEEQGFVPLLDAGDSPRGPWIVMPFVPGGTLRDRLRRGPLAVPEVVELGKSLASALGRAHARGIVHRDVKPENVLFTADGRPLVADLGIAKHFQEEGHGASVSLSQTGEIRGTIGYMAREQMQDAKSIGPASDVFSLGAVLYECLAGEPAFEGETLVGIMSRVERGDFVPLRERRPDVPPPLARAVERALHREPLRRWADCAAFARGLEGKHGAPRPLMLAALGGVAISAGLVVAFAYGASSPEKPAAPVAPKTVVEAKPAAVKLRRAGVLGRTGLAQDGRVRGAAWDPRRRIAVTANLDATLRVVDLATGRELRKSDVGKPLECVTLSSDGRLALAGGFGKHALLVELESGVTQASIDMEAVVQSVALSADARTGLIGTDDGVVKLVRFAPREELFRFGGAKGTVGAVGLSPDGKWAIVGDADFAVRYVKLTPGNYSTKQMGAHHGRVSSIAFSRDSRLAITGSFDETAQIWNLSKLAPIRTLTGHQGPISWVALSPDGARAASIGADGLREWDVATGKLLAFHKARDGRMCVVAFDDEGRLVDLTTGEPAAPLCGHTAGVTGISVSPDSKRAVSVGEDQTLRTWDLATGAELAALEGRRPRAVAWVGVPTFIEERAVFSWEPDGQVTQRARADGRLTMIASSGDVAIASGEHELLGWQETSDPWRSLEPGSLAAVAAGGGRVVTLGLDRHVRAVDARTRASLAVVELREPATTLAVSSDGKTALVGGRDRKVHAVSLDATGATRDVAAFRSPIRALATDGSRVAALTEDGAIALHEIATGRSIDRTELKPDVPTALAFTPDGRTLLVGTARGPIVRFDVGEQR
jgi:WD40 repeat protein